MTPENEMTTWRRIINTTGHAHFVTFSCYKRRRLLDDDRAKGVVIHFLADELRKIDAACNGFVIMPDHVHALLRFGGPNMLSRFIQQWKRRSSIRLKEFIRELLPAYAAAIDLEEPIWQAGFHNFDVFSDEKVREKIEYMHGNPVRKGLVARVEDWKYGSARWYLLKRSVGVEITALP